MRVKKINNDYEFTCSTVNGEFIVKLTLTESGEEMLNTQPTDAPATFPPRVLEPGTIRKAIGEDRWNNFIRMKDKGFDDMFIDAHRKGFIPHSF